MIIRCKEEVTHDSILTIYIDLTKANNNANITSR